MAKKLSTFNLDEEVIEALDETLRDVPMSKSAFVNLLIGGACGLYDTGEILGTMFRTAGVAHKAKESIIDDSKNLVVI